MEKKYVGQTGLSKLIALVKAALEEKTDKSYVDGLVGEVARALDDINGEAV